jgi:hypothetical protein
MAHAGMIPGNVSQRKGRVDRWINWRLGGKKDIDRYLIPFPDRRWREERKAAECEKGKIVQVLKILTKRAASPALQKLFQK